MATTVSAVQTLVNQFIQDTSTVSVTAADRLAAISMAAAELLTELNLPQSVLSYNFSYYDGINYYKLSSDIPSHIEPGELRRKAGLNTRAVPFSRKDPNEMNYIIDSGSGEDAFAIEQRDGSQYLVINHQSAYSAALVHDCDSLTNNGTWAVDATNSDATNLTLDDVEYTQGSAGFNFDIDVSQSGNNRATISTSDMTAIDMSDDENLSSLVFDVYIPDVTYISSFTTYWGDSASAYWSGSATTEFNGNAFVAGWNTVKVDWADTTMTGSPDATDIDYIRIDMNYNASQGDDTDFRIDNIRMIRPETLTYLYQSSYVGANSSGTKLLAFTATADVPFYSGAFDHFNIAVARRAAAILFDQMGMHADADRENGYYTNEINKYRKKFPSVHQKESKRFKTKWSSFRRR